jgi:Gpi18-like mannosyltransferase
VTALLAATNEHVRLHRLRCELTAWVLPSVVAPYLVTRAALLLAAEVAWLTIPHATIDGTAPPAITVDWSAPLLKWDAAWYVDIARDWYHFSPLVAPEANPVAFFPLYPLLIRVFNAVILGSDRTLPASALIVANLSALLGLAVLYRLVQSEFGTRLAQRTVWYFVVFPVSFYLTAAYAEPVFLAACVIAIYAARANRWWLGGVAGAAATLSRPYGILIICPLAIEYIRQHRKEPGGLMQASALAVLLPGIALLAWMSYLYALSGDPLIFVKTQAGWDNQQLTSPLQTLLSNYSRTRDQQLQGKVDLRSLQFGIAVLGIVASIATWRVLPVTYAVFATVFCLVVLSSGSMLSIWRHIYLIFPLSIVAAKAGAYSEVFDRAYVASSLIFAGLLFTILATGWNLVS